MQKLPWFDLSSPRLRSLWRLQEMKTASDPRHLKRIKLMQQLFAASFRTKPDFSVKNIWEKLDVIDPLIAKAAPEWPLDRINPTDLAILRLAIWELVIDKTTPLRVIIDESIELAKEFGSDNSPAFVNGVLGSLTKVMQLQEAIIQFLANEWKQNSENINLDVQLSDFGWNEEMLDRLQESLELSLPEDHGEIVTVGDLISAYDKS